MLQAEQQVSVVVLQAEQQKSIVVLRAGAVVVGLRFSCRQEQLYSGVMLQAEQQLSNQINYRCSSRYLFG